MTKILLAVILAATSGCYATTAGIEVQTPDLVYAAPGVEVIANYDEPIFFVDGAYWWWYSGAWYRSAYYTGGWTYVATPPRALLTIPNRVAYRHYRPHGYTPRHRPAPAHTIRRPAVRDHRARR